LVWFWRAFPAREDWEQWLITHDEQDSLSYKIRKLQAIETLGAETLVVSADVSDMSQMASVITQAQERFGPINGVIHSAGLADYAGVIQRRSRQATETILAPKVKGTLVLDTLLAGAPLDFFVLCSTLGSLLPQVKGGEVGYCAANEFLDAFTYFRNLRDGQFTVTINWTDWQEVGMSVEARRRARSLSMGQAGVASSSARVPHLVVSAQELTSLIEQMDSLNVLKFKSSSQETQLSKPAHPRPDLSNAYVAPRNELEGKIAGIWQNLLGVELVGVYDNFFELCGDSLLIIQVHSRLQEQIGAGLSIGEMFEYPTISTLAKHLTQEHPLKPAQQVQERAERQRLAFARQKQLAVKEKWSKQ
jgi:NADP-dependent 3-hydroxy acid dehydrogenase YdfG